MEQLHWFYIVGLVILIIPNAIAIGLKKSVSLNIFQIAAYLAVMICFLVLDKTSGLTEKFFFLTGLVFLVTFAIEFWQFATKTRVSFWANFEENCIDFCFLILSVVPIVCSMGFLSGFFL